MLRLSRFGVMAMAVAFGLSMGCKSEQAVEPAAEKKEEKAPAPQEPQKKTDEPVAEKAKAQVEDPKQAEPKPAEAPKPEGTQAAKPAEGTAPQSDELPTTGHTMAADVLPADVGVVIGTFGAEEWMKLLADIGLTKEKLLKNDPEFQEALDALGVNPLTVEGLKELGLDVVRMPVLAFVPSSASDMLGIFAIPMAEGRSGVALLKQIFTRRKAEDQKKVSLEETTIGKTLVLWATKEKSEKKELAAVMDLGGYCLLVLPLDPGSDAEAVRAEVRTLASRLADVKTERLVSVPGFDAATEGISGSIGSMLVTSRGLIPLMMKDSDSAKLVPFMATFDAAMLWAEEKENTARMGMRVITKEANGYFTTRDTTVRNIVPVDPLLGLHVALDSSKLIPILEGMLQNEERFAKEYAEGWKQAVKALGVPEGTRIQDLWNGEIGFFMGALTKDEQAMVRSLAGFLGVANEALVRQGIEGALKALGLSGMVKSEIIGQASTWRFSVPPIDAGMALVGKRLWFAGDFAAIQALATGEGKLIRSERGQQVTAVMATAAPKVFYIDLQRFMLALMPLMSSGDKEDMLEAMPLIIELNTGAISVQEVGKTVTAQFDVTMNSPVRSIAVRLLQQLVNRELERGTVHE